MSRHTLAGSVQKQTVELTLPEVRVVELQMRAAQAASVAKILYVCDITHEFRVDRMKSEFLTTAAHELRTPMASIFGFSELLMSREFSGADRREYLEIIFKQSQLMASIIDELLDLARIEGSKEKAFKFESLEIRDLLQEVLRGFAPTKGRTAPILNAPKLSWVVADRYKLTQAVMNVLSNAYKYSLGGEILVELASRKDSEHIQWIGIQITDQGIGMTEAQQSRIFDRFYRADQTGSTPGVGLGMSIVSEIMRFHGGDVEVKSNTGQGTTITLWMREVPRSTADSLQADNTSVRLRIE